MHSPNLSDVRVRARPCVGVYLIASRVRTILAARCHGDQANRPVNREAGDAASPPLTSRNAGMCTSRYLAALRLISATCKSLANTCGTHF